MIGAVLQSVARAAVAGRRANGDALRGRRLQHAVERLRGLRLPDRLRAAPADRDHRRLVLRVVDGRVDGLDETRIAVRREVDGDCRGGRDRAGDLDVERDFAVRAVRIAGRRVAAGADVHVDEPRRRLDAEPAEVPRDVRCAVAAAELDDRDALAGAVAGRKPVQRRELRRRERDARRAARGLERRAQPEVRARLRAAVEAEHGRDRIAELVRQCDRPRAAAILPDRVMLETLERHAERGFELLDGARQHDDAFGRIDAIDRQLMTVCEVLGLADVVGACREALRECIARQRFGLRIAAGEPLEQRIELPFFLPPQHDRDVDAFCRIARAETLGVGDDSGFAVGVKMPCHVQTLLCTALHGTARKSDMADGRRFRMVSRVRGRAKSQEV
ncbi:hypothetical protein FEP65_06391 [Burkholderia multivorans]|nr:hypothetical protein [Burkholderia multivorans]